jgi:hypothetical protein
LRFRQGLRLDQQTLSFVAAPALAEAHDHGMSGAFRRDPAREQRISGRQELEIGSGAGEPPLPLGQGMSVALSAHANTAIVGGWGAEAAWVFTRSGGSWTQQGKKLVGTGAVGKARQGMSVALSADGNTAIVGGWSDNSKTGASNTTASRLSFFRTACKASRINA